jgi:sterol desaturase/sphingolipid hydroxylase (fatty acid hydroxylase superfamily)
MAFFLFLSMAYSKRKTLIILRRYILEYTLEVNDIWAQRASIIREIQNKRFIGFLSYYPEINAEKIRFIIETLRFENSTPQYKCQFFNVFSVLFSVVAGAFLAAVIAIPELLTSWDSVIIFFKPIIGFSVMFVLFTWFFETMLLKDIFKSSANKYGRLLKILQDYYLSID